MPTAVRRAAWTCKEPRGLVLVHRKVRDMIRSVEFPFPRALSAQPPVK